MLIFQAVVEANSWSLQNPFNVNNTAVSKGRFEFCAGASSSAQKNPPEKCTLLFVSPLHTR